MARELPIPFFVVDRPMSLELLKFCEISKQNGKLGLMGHANTSKNFQRLFKEFSGENIVKIVDSGVFTKNGCNLDYDDLFSIYSNMGTDYGIMIDFLKDKNQTIKSAKEAIKIYNKGKYSFKLVGVAQGNTINEYVECYNELKSLGFENIAIGGLLKKNINSARYVKVNDENFLKLVLKNIRKLYPDDWIFTLGCFHPKRYNLFKEFNVFGADYKGWILNYRTPQKCIENINKELEVIESDLKNEDLNKLLKKKIILENLYKKGENLALKEVREEIIELDNEILNFRKKIANNLNNKEYSQKVKKLEKFLYMDKKTKRDYRFKQIRSYLYKNVFSLLKTYLLIISCSKRKTTISNPAPAIDLYDGPTYKMIKKIEQNNSLNNVHISIISAKYGLLGAYDLIEKYNQKMTKNRAKELNKKLINDLSLFLNNKDFEEIFINLGQDYLLSIKNLDFNTKTIHAKGKMGQKLSSTKNWIEKITHNN